MVRYVLVCTVDCRYVQGEVEVVYFSYKSFLEGSCFLVYFDRYLWLLIILLVSLDGFWVVWLGYRRYLEVIVFGCLGFFFGLVIIILFFIIVGNR